MKLGNKLKPQAAPLQPARRKTTADFLRWLKKRRASEKLKADKEANQAAQEMKDA
jgi:hypothetical protein